jgi:hypothetical protein
MGVVIEIYVKYPGGPTRIKGTDILYRTIQVQYTVHSTQYTVQVRYRYNRQLVPYGTSHVSGVYSR